MKTYNELVEELCKEKGLMPHSQYPLANYDFFKEVLQRYTEISNSHKPVFSGKRLTPELFCKVHSQFHGEEIDNIKQLSMATYDGETLYELCTAICQAAGVPTRSEGKAVE